MSQIVEVTGAINADEVTKPFSFGVIGDTQYVDADDGSTFDGSTIRRYRQSLSTLESACASFKSSQTSLCILLGDTVDGKCKSMELADSCLEKIQIILKQSDSPWHFCIGNHDLICFSREQIFQKLTAVSMKLQCSPSRLYYDFSPSVGYRFIFLDGYDVSTINASSDTNKALAIDILTSKNPNLSVEGAGWFEGLTIENQRFVPYNGGLSENQLRWFDETLKLARNNGDRCFIFSHMPCYISCCRPSGLIWNSEKIVEIMHQHKGAVAAFIAGHDHDGGYAVDEVGIHHLVLPSPLECAKNEVAYGHITIPDTSLSSSPFFELHWTGKVPQSTNYASWPKKMLFPPNN